MSLFTDLKGTTAYEFFIGRFLDKVYFRSNSGTGEIKNKGGSYSPIEYESNKNVPNGYLGLDVNSKFSLGTFTNSKIARYTVLGAFAGGEVIDLTTGSGSITGTSSPTGDNLTISLPGTFILSPYVVVSLNGVIQMKGSDIVYDSATTFHFTIPLDAGDVFEVTVFE